MGRLGLCLFKSHDCYLIVRFQSVEVVSVFPFPRAPSKPDLVNLRREDRQVGFQVAIQEVGHYNPVGHHVDHHVPDPRKKFHLMWRCQGVSKGNPPDPQPTIWRDP